MPRRRSAVLRISLLILLVVNALFLVFAVCIPSLPLTSPDMELSLRVAYTELDRAGVIDQARLAKYDPSLAHDARNNVPHWMAKPALDAQAKHNVRVARIAATIAVV